VNAASIAAMRRRQCQCAAQPVGVGGGEKEMHMVGHRAPGPNFDLGRAAVLRQKIAVERIIVVAEECARAAVATLGDMVRKTGDDDRARRAMWYDPASKPRWQLSALSPLSTVLQATAGTSQGSRGACEALLIYGCATGRAS